MDDKVVISSNTGAPLVLQKESKAGMALQRIALRLDGHPDLPVENPMKPNNFWKKLGFRFSRKK